MLKKFLLDFLGIRCWCYWQCRKKYWLARGIGWTKLNYTEYIQYPEESGFEDIKTTINMELIRATINGEHYGCLTTYALGGNAREDAREDDLNVLKKYRDNVLSKTQEGQELIKLYYQWSPVIVKAMEADEEFKQEIKELVDEVLPLIEGRD